MTGSLYKRQRKLATVTALSTLLLYPLGAAAQVSTENKLPSIEIFMDSFESLQPVAPQVVPALKPMPVPLKMPVVSHAPSLPATPAKAKTLPRPKKSMPKKTATKPIVKAAPPVAKITVPKPLETKPPVALAEKPVALIVPSAPVIKSDTPATHPAMMPLSQKPLSQKTIPQKIEESKGKVIVLQDLTKPLGDEKARNLVMPPELQKRADVPVADKKPLPEKVNTAPAPVPLPPVPQPKSADRPKNLPPLPLPVMQPKNLPAPVAKEKVAVERVDSPGILDSIKKWNPFATDTPQAVVPPQKTVSKETVMPAKPMPQLPPLPPAQVVVTHDLPPALPDAPLPLKTPPAVLPPQAAKIEPAKPLPLALMPVKKVPEAVLPVSQPQSVASLPKPPVSAGTDNMVNQIIDKSKLFSLNFVKNQLTITDLTKTELTKQLQTYVHSPKRFTIVSYASNDPDQSGSDRRVSLQRAIAVRQFIIEMGIDDMRINVQAMGDTSPSGNKDHVDIFTITEASSIQ